MLRNDDDYYKFIEFVRLLQGNKMGLGSAAHHAAAAAAAATSLGFFYQGSDPLGQPPPAHMGIPSAGAIGNVSLNVVLSVGVGVAFRPRVCRAIIARSDCRRAKKGCRLIDTARQCKKKKKKTGTPFHLSRGAPFSAGRFKQQLNCSAPDRRRIRRECTHTRPVKGGRKERVDSFSPKGALNRRASE